MSDDEPYTTGNFEVRRRVLPPIHVDCSQWVDTSDGEWTFGNLEVRRRVLPPITVDCSEWGREAVTHLELLVTFDATADPDRLTEQTVAVVEGILTLAPPALGLTYAGAEPLPDGDVKVLLRTDRPATDAEVAELNRLLGAELAKPAADRRPAFRNVGEFGLSIAA